MRQVSNWCALAAAVAGAGCSPRQASPCADQATAPAGLQPYTARYQVSYRGLNGGEIESSFKRGSAAGQWQYETRVFPTLLARVAISSQAHELSVIQVTAAGVRPLSFNFNDGSARCGQGRPAGLRLEGTHASPAPSRASRCRCRSRRARTTRRRCRRR